MRVKCIKKCTQYSGKKPYWYSPDVGEILDVIETIIKCGRLLYDLSGYSEFFYDASCFEVIRDEPAEVIEEQEPEYETA